MDEDKLADLNDIRDFFDRVGTICKNASSTGEFYTNPIDVKDFIEWCNDPCKNISENSPHSDPAYKLGKTVRELNELNENKLKEMESALKKTDGMNGAKTTAKRYQQTMLFSTLCLSAAPTISDITTFTLTKMRLLNSTPLTPLPKTRMVNKF